MKKIALAFIALFVTLCAGGNTVEQSDTARFMTSYRHFVQFVDRQPSLTRQMADSLIARQDTLMHQYRQLKPRLSDAQVEEYNKLKGRYTKKLLEYRGDRFSDGVMATGDSIAKATGRVGKAVGGFFKGLFER